MVDRTDYSAFPEPPALPVRQIFGRQRVEAKTCQLAAKLGLLTVERFAMLGDSLTTVKDTLKVLSPEENAFGDTPAVRELTYMTLAAVWQACSAMQSSFATRRARMEEDPSKVPEMSSDDHSAMRRAFVATHPDVVLFDAREPHRKFVEKLNRDYLVHGCVPFYELAEIRSRADVIQSKAGLTRSAEDLLTISRADLPEPVTDVNEALNRVHAFIVALEYLNVAPYSGKSGALRYLRALELFKNEMPGLASIITLDSLFRKKIYKLQFNEREAYETFSSAMTEVLDNHKYLVNEARTKHVLQEVEQRGSKRALHSSPPPDRTKEGGDKGQGSPKKGLNKKKHDKRKLLIKEAKEARAAKDQGKSFGADKKGGSQPTKIPSQEWTKITEASKQVKGERRCHYFNSSAGCRIGDKCKFVHKCMACGDAHAMVGNH